MSILRTCTRKISSSTISWIAWSFDYSKYSSLYEAPKFSSSWKEGGIDLKSKFGAQGVKKIYVDLCATRLHKTGDHKTRVSIFDGQTICSIILRLIFPMKFWSIFNHGDETFPNSLLQSLIIRIFFVDEYISRLFGPIPVVVVSRLQLSYLMVVNSCDEVRFDGVARQATCEGIITLCRSKEDVGHCRHPSSFPLTSTPSELLLQHLRSNLLVFENGTTARSRRL